MNFPKLPSQKEAMKTNQYSQHGEEVVLQKIFDHIGTTNKFFVDYGAGDGYNLSNTRHFLNNGWTGLMMDGFHESKDVKKEMAGLLYPATIPMTSGNTGMHQGGCPEEVCRFRRIARLGVLGLYRCLKSRQWPCETVGSETVELCT